MQLGCAHAENGGLTFPTKGLRRSLLGTDLSVRLPRRLRDVTV